MKKPELLLPASSPEVLRTAILYGADAIYIGGDMYGLRANAKNFSHDAMADSIKYAHDHGKKVYVTANITPHNPDLGGMREYFKELSHLTTKDGESAVPDAVIISDPGAFMMAREEAPNIDIHISTQANNVNYLTYNFWKQQGATRVVSARELGIAEIKDIREHIPEDMEIETFIHGAMCISYSGRCLLSNYFTGRDANLGACTHPCRWKYYITEETRPGEYLPIEENERGTYIFNSKDLCMIEHIPDLIDAGIDSYKIEGRMKTALYVASAARSYRTAIDDFFKDPALYESRLDYYKSEVAKCTNRRYTTGFFYGKPSDEAQVYDSATYVTEYVYLGFASDVCSDGYIRMEQKNKFCVGDEIEIMKPDGRDVTVKVLDILDDETGLHQDSCPHAKQIIRVRFSENPEVGEILRVKG